ncbi:MAG TPA: hypothetical protein VFY73_19545 [Ideonella sp.]|uniref:hypothetical protein n=1 Tax=Ideonella sp. TaxID=1929293 RepID=UPI002E356BE9|nr:hypothetical protein [Ideonella sp.]HEX5686229.1 hypothetical protein [Ideonella sp.]
MSPSLDNRSPDYDALFHDYAAVFERSLGDVVDSAAIRGFFAESFVSAGPNGQLQMGSNDTGFEQALQQAYGFYKAIGTQRMWVERVRAQAIDGEHDIVQVAYIAEYLRPDGERLSIPFQVSYLMQRRAQGPKIFGFVAGDEMAVYRQHGLVDDQGQPVS